MRHVFALPLLFCFLARALAQAPTDGTRTEAAPPRDLTAVLDRDLRGQPVVAVNIGALVKALPEGAPVADAPGTDAPLLERLQAIAAAASDEHVTLIPFAVRGTWTIAPQEQEIVNPDLRRLTPLTVSSRDALLQRLLRGLNAAQAAKLGGPGGLGFSDLSPDQGAMFERALRPPLRIEREEPRKPGQPRQTTVLTRLENPLNLRAVRLRANLAYPIFILHLPDGTGAFTDPNAFGDRWLTWDNWEDEGAEPRYALPAFVPAPNRFKPSDLDGARLAAPIGLSGVHPLADVLKQAGKLTGLRLVADEPYRALKVFIGRPDIPAGDVLDALRLSLAATWRRLGGACILAWDRRGIGAVLREIFEVTHPLLSTLGTEDETETYAAGRRFAQTLSFRPDDPLALTDEQRRRLLAEKMDEIQPEMETGPDGRVTLRWKGGIPFDEMTPAQQERLRELAARTTVNVRGEDPGRRPLTEEDLRQARLEGSMTVVLRLSAPEIGEAVLRPSIVFVSMAQMPVSPAGEGGAPVVVSEKERAQIRAMAGKTWAPHAPDRALMVPVLGPARLAALADEMRRAGLNTLFYPALYGGYATFPAKSFPLDPALREKDGLAAAVAAMKPHGIRVVAYLHTLAWQEQAAPVHWLDKHPEWLDRDILGRSRLEWAEQNPAERAYFASMRVPVRNYVSPRVPEVEARLNRFLDELSGRDGLSGVAFSEWSPLQSHDYVLPSLGYTMADRLAAFRATGLDPVDDEVTAPIPPPKSLSNLPAASAGPEMSPPRPSAPDAFVPLLARLLRRAKTARPAWTTYAFEESNGQSLVEFDASRANGYRPGEFPGPPPGFPFGPPPGPPAPEKRAPEDTPKADVVISILNSDRDHATWLRVAPFGQGFYEHEEIFPAELLKDLTAVHLALLDHEQDIEGHQTMMVLDFRDAPSAITDSLRFIRPPESAPIAAPVAAPVAAAKKSAPRR